MSITSSQILAHRSAQKEAALAGGPPGCITGRPVPQLSFFGYKDVQSWRPEDPMKPYCFCFDCRTLWDGDASIDLQLLTEGHVIAKQAYKELFPDFVEATPVSSLFAQVSPPGFSNEPLSVSTDIHESISDVIQNLIRQLTSEEILAMDSKRRAIFAKTFEGRQAIVDQSIAYEETCRSAINFLTDLDSRILAHRQALFEE